MIKSSLTVGLLPRSLNDVAPAVERGAFRFIEALVFVSARTAAWLRASDPWAIEGGALRLVESLVTLSARGRELLPGFEHLLDELSDAGWSQREPTSCWRAE